MCLVMTLSCFGLVGTLNTFHPPQQNLMTNCQKKRETHSIEKSGYLLFCTALTQHEKSFSKQLMFKISNGGLRQCFIFRM